MNGPDITAQEYLYRAIRAAVASDVPVETRPRTNGPLPYVYVGSASLREHPVGYEISVAVDVWSTKEGPIQGKQIQQQVRTALDGVVHTDVTESASATVWRFTLIHEELAITQLERANSVWHGAQKFRVLAESQP